MKNIEYEEHLKSKNARLRKENLKSIMNDNFVNSTFLIYILSSENVKKD